MVTIEELLEQRTIQKFGKVSALADEAGIPRSTVRNYLAHGFDNQAILNYITICELLEVDAQHLLEGRIVERRTVEDQLDLSWGDLSTREKRMIMTLRERPELIEAFDTLTGGAGMT